MHRHDWFQFLVVPSVMDPTQAEGLGEPFELAGIVTDQRVHDRPGGLLMVSRYGRGLQNMLALLRPYPAAVVRPAHA